MHGMNTPTRTPHWRAPQPFGEYLRHWRQHRRLSQLDLARDAEISTRHLSFVETGRSLPSREMVLRLAEPAGRAAAGAQRLAGGGRLCADVPGASARPSRHWRRRAGPST